MSQCFYACVEAPETDLSSLQHKVEVIERLGFENELTAGREEVKMLVEHQPRRCKDRQKFNIVDGLWKRVLHQTQTWEDEASEQTR